MNTWRVTYLLPRVELANAVEERGLPGQYRHVNLVSARDDGEVISQVRARGGVPLSVTPVHPPRLRLRNARSAARRERLLQAMVLSVHSGLSATTALQRALESGAVADDDITQAALTVLRAGGGFSDAVRTLGMFDESTVAILESGERTGRMRDSLQAALDHFQKRANGIKAMVGAVTWTLFDLAFAFVSIVGMRFSLLPSIAESGLKGQRNVDAAAQASFEQALRMAFIVNDAAIVFTFVLLGVTAFCVLGHFSQNPELRRRVDAFLRKVPALGPALEHNAVSASFTVAAAMLRGGVTFPFSAEVAARATQYEPAHRLWTQARERVANGLGVVRAMQSSLLQTSEMLLLASHSSQAQLARVLGDIATQRDALAMSASRRFAVVMFLGSLAYSGIAVLFTLWVVYLQNEQLMSASQGF